MKRKGFTTVCGRQVALKTFPNEPFKLRGLDSFLASAYIKPVVFVRSYDMVYRPRDLADRMARRRKPDDGYIRETYALPREDARKRARAFLNEYPKAAYMSEVESWREVPGDRIEFTMRRLRTAD